MFKMKLIIFMLFSTFSVYALEVKQTELEFVASAEKLVEDLKKSLMTKLKEQMEQKGAIGAVEFCHTNAGPLAKNTAGDRLNHFKFGRTSHKLRNEKNQPTNWVAPYLEKFQGTFEGDSKTQGVIPRIMLVENKRAYLSPIYVKAQCLVCHGEAVAAPLKQKLTQLYPKDQAQGFKLNEFRGFFWVMEK
jgi:hypothetical protein